MATRGIYEMIDTWNNGSTVFNAIKMDVTNTASAVGSKIVDLQVGSVSRFSVDPNGNLVLGTQQVTQGSVVLSNTAAGSYPITIKSSNSSTVAWTLTLPTSAGNNGQVLSTNGSGVTSWIDAASSVSTLSGLGTNVATALAVNVGTDGAFVVRGGALCTPSSGTLTNATGLPVGGISATGSPSATTYLRGDGSWATLSTVSSIGYTIDAVGTVISTGRYGNGVIVPFNCTITEWTLISDVSGSIVIDIWKDTYANYPPTVLDSITASAKPTISASTTGQSSTLTGWTTNISAGDILYFNVDSCSSITEVTISLKVNKT